LIGTKHAKIRANKIPAPIRQIEFLSQNRLGDGIGIVIFRSGLHLAETGLSLAHMLRWRATMRELSAEARLHFYARSLSRRSAPGLHTAALYGSLAMIAAVVFGTLSVHPF
jgi:hypothetical protein